MQRSLATAALLLTALGCGTDKVLAPGEPSPLPPTILFTTPIAGTPLVDLFYGAYRDHGSRDYECGAKYYPGHGGTDILLRNFTVQDSGVAVLAAAPGRVNARVDGLFDRNTTNGSGGFGNYVALSHDDGVVSIYGHLRSGSVRVALGADVNRGDTLGFVGSSGNSSWPHLHFEVRRSGSVVDPFVGACNPSVPQLSWMNQLPYQSEFQVMDAGLTTLPVVTQANLLERPEDTEIVRVSDDSFLYWMNLFNVRAAELRVELRDPTGAVVAEGRSVGPVHTFSVRFFTVRFGVESLPGSGSYMLVAYMTPLSGSELEIARRAFLFDATPPAATAASPRASRADARIPDVWLGPEGGDM